MTTGGCKPTTPPNKPEDVEQVADGLIDSSHDCPHGKDGQLACPIGEPLPKDCSRNREEWYFNVDCFRQQLIDALSSERAKQREKDARIAETYDANENCCYDSGWCCGHNQASCDISRAIRKAGGG